MGSDPLLPKLIEWAPIIEWPYRIAGPCSSFATHSEVMHVSMARKDPAFGGINHDNATG